MAILKTTIDIRDAAFAENTAVMRGLAEDLHAKVFKVMQGEGKARDRHAGPFSAGYEEPSASSRSKLRALT